MDVITTLDDSKDTPPLMRSVCLNGSKHPPFLRGKRFFPFGLLILYQIYAIIDTNNNYSIIQSVTGRRALDL